MKQEIKHIIRKLTDWKDFVFADPYKKQAYAHCTHLQIAQADPQTEICKRVQFLPVHTFEKLTLLRYPYVERL